MPYRRVLERCPRSLQAEVNAGSARLGWDPRRDGVKRRRASPVSFWPLVRHSMVASFSSSDSLRSEGDCGPLSQYRGANIHNGCQLLGRPAGGGLALPL